MTDMLVLNAGSSSLKFRIYGPADADGPALQLSGQIDGIGLHARALARDASGKVPFEQQWPPGEGPRDHHTALALLVEKLKKARPDWTPVAVGHRVVHGGSQFRVPVIITDSVRAALEALVPLAPLHQPANLSGIDAARKAFPSAVQVSCFDTAFHQGHPWVADTFALPRALYDEGLRRYGFHGLSYAYIVRAMRKLAPQVARGKMVVAHLGNGASLCAIADGQSVDSTMSFTALDGLCMGTRSGQIDPGALLYLLEQKQMTPQALSDLLYKQSGLLGLSGISSDMRDLLSHADPRAQEAVDFFVYRIVCSVGALAGALGGLNAIVFTAGIGENSPAIRERVCRGLAWLGVDLDTHANATKGPLISTSDAKVSAWVVPTDEERMIALHVQEILGESHDR